MSIRVLIVDDDEETTLAMQILLRAEGFDVERARSGREALRLLACRRFDSLLTDIAMTDIDGDALLSATPRDGLGFVAVVSGFDAPERCVLERLKIDVWMQKPVDIDLLVRAIRSSVVCEQRP